MDLIVSEDYIKHLNMVPPPPPKSFKFNAITYGNSKFVAVGKDILISFDASLNIISMSTTTGGVNTNYVSVAYGNIFVAVTNNKNTIAYTNDGIIWTSVTTYTGYWNSITYGNGKFVAVGNGPINKIMYNEVNNVVTKFNNSYVIKNEDNTPNTTLYRLVSLTNITFGKTEDNVDIFVAIGSPHIIFSTNGKDWYTPYTKITNTTLLTIGYGNGWFVIMCADNKILWSSNGNFFYSSLRQISNNYKSIAFFDNIFLAISDDIKDTYIGQNILYSTKDPNIMFTTDQSKLDNWALTNGIKNAWKSVAYGNNMLLAVSDKSNFLLKIIPVKR